VREVPPGARSLAVSPDGKTLAVGGQSGPSRPPGPNEETIRLLDAATGKVIRELPGGGDALRFLPDGKTLAAVAISHGGYKRIDDPNGKGYHRVNVAHGRLHLWDVTTGKPISQWWGAKAKKRVSELSLGEFCYGLAFSLDGKTLAVQEWEGTTHLW